MALCPYNAHSEASCQLPLKVVQYAVQYNTPIGTCLQVQAKKRPRRGHVVTMNENPPEVSFLRALRRTMLHLYDPAALRASPLWPLLRLQPQESPSRLRKVLIEAIEALKPDADASLQSSEWRSYRTLTHRYVDQFSQQEVATTLGLSLRQMRRQESLALRVLADYLAVHCDLHLDALLGEESENGASDEPSDAEAIPSREEELQWLEKTLPNEAADVQGLIDGLLQIVIPLTRALQVRIDCALPQGLPRVAVQVASLRQACLNILTAAIRAVPGGTIRIEIEEQEHQALIRITPTSHHGDMGLATGDVLDNLEMARQLVGLSGGVLSIVPDEAGSQPFKAILALPIAEQAAVLVIDDNADTLHLFQRYLAGTRYPFMGARDPAQALALARELAPRIIVLDVMLPGIDGWELLGRLREHPQTTGVPVIVCTILPQEQLALSLGAAAFIRKPVSRSALLAALDREMARPSRGSESAPASRPGAAAPKAPRGA